MKIQYISTNKILPSNFNMHPKETDADLAPLVLSISNMGIVQPVILRSIYNFYELISGSRRYEAARILGMKEIPAIVLNVSPMEGMQIALADNIQHKPMSYFDEAESFQYIMSYYGCNKSNISSAIGKDVSYVVNRLSTLSLNKEEKSILKRNNISLDNTLSFLKLDRETRHKVMGNMPNENSAIHTSIIKESLDKIQKENSLNSDIKYFSGFIKDSVNKMKDFGFDTSFVIMKGFDNCTINITLSAK